MRRVTFVSVRPIVVAKVEGERVGMANMGVAPDNDKTSYDAVHGRLPAAPTWKVNAAVSSEIAFDTPFHVMVRRR